MDNYSSATSNNEADQLAKRAYEIINSKASSNMTIQGISGLIGFPYTIIADGAVILTHYVPLMNQIRTLYRRIPINEELLTPLIKNIMSEILFDIVNDKILGQIPIIGVYFNLICAKTMTWRLGILFTMLSSRGEEIDDLKVKDTMKLIRLVFPQNDTYKFRQPNFETFRRLVVSVYDNSKDQYAEKITKALDAF